MMEFSTSYAQVYPQINVTDIFMMYYLWRKVERSGE
jgi:hypothetical protein